MFNPVDQLEDPIDGDRFANMCKYFLNDRGRQLEGIENENAIIFCRTDNLQELFNLIRNNGKKYILITQNSDHNIDETRYSWKPENVVHWFAQNIVIKKSDLFPIPIGLERSFISCRSGNLEEFKQNITGIWTKNAHAYANFSNSTHVSRPIIKDYLRNSGWCTVTEERIPIRHFLAEIRRHNFCISPPGNGSDTHRMWEALYSGTVPVCFDNIHNREFAKILPVVLYNDIKEITLEYLEKQQIEIAQKIKINHYTFHALRFSFWRELIEHYGKALL